MPENEHDNGNSCLTSDAPSATRRHFLAVATAAVLLRPAAAQADIFGADIAVLLAQLEQQIQSVSHAVATVQNLVATVDRLGTVVSNGKQLLQHAGDNGLTGILDAAQGSTRLLTGTLRNLKRINGDVQWWQRELATSRGLTKDNAAKLSEARHQWNMKTLESASDALDAYQAVDDSYEDLKQSQDIVTAATKTDGVVGQVQLLGRQHYLTQKSLLQLAQTQARGMQVLTNAEAGRSLDSEARHKNTVNLLEGYTTPGSPSEVMTELP